VVVSKHRQSVPPAPLLTNEAMEARCRSDEVHFCSRDDESCYYCGMMFARDFYEREMTAGRDKRLARLEAWIAAIFRESGPGSHPGRTPEEAARFIGESEG
jgi:hypothetical protein